MSIKHLGRQLRAERLKRKWTMERVVEEVNAYSFSVNAVTMCEAMDASHYPSLRVLIKLCELYDLEIAFTEVKDGQEAEEAHGTTTT